MRASGKQLTLIANVEPNPFSREARKGMQIFTLMIISLPKPTVNQNSFKAKESGQENGNPFFCPHSPAYSDLARLQDRTSQTALSSRQPGTERVMNSPRADFTV